MFYSLLECTCAGAFVFRGQALSQIFFCKEAIPTCIRARNTCSATAINADSAAASDKVVRDENVLPNRPLTTFFMP